MKVISYKLKGNSCPVVIEQENQKHLVKLSAGLSGEFSLLCEWFGNLIGKSIGLNTRIPEWILLTDSLDYKDIYIEVRDLIDKSLGINIAFEYYEKVNEINLAELSKAEKAKFTDVYLLDVLMINIDRTIQNHNLISTEDNKILISDFDSSLIFNELLNNTKPSTNISVLQCLRANPFYQPLEKINLERFIERINHVNFEAIVDKIPNELLNSQNKATALTRIESKKLNNWNLREVLLNIDEVTLESESERNIRTKINRDKLEKRISSSNKIKKNNCL